MNRNISHPRTRGQYRGFSLIELLVVIAIIVILAGIVVGAMVKINRSKDIRQTRVNIQNTRLKLEEYANDNNGLYPSGDDSTSAAAFRALSGDSTGRGEVPENDVYWSELNNRKNPALVGTVQGRKVILDGFGNTLRYLSAIDSSGELVEGVKNDSDFDLWSTGPDGEPASLETTGLTESEQTKDDIWE